MEKITSKMHQQQEEKSQKIPKSGTKIQGPIQAKEKVQKAPKLEKGEVIVKGEVQLREQLSYLIKTMGKLRKQITSMEAALKEHRNQKEGPPKPGAGETTHHPTRGEGTKIKRWRNQKR